MDKLNLLRLFLLVVDTGAFASAAAEEGLSPSTISKAIGRLERSLNLVLFHRSTRQLTLTKAGITYAETARQLIENLHDCERQLLHANYQPKGVLRMNMPVSYGRLYLLPMLRGFTERYPEIQLDLSFDDSYVDLIRQGFDIAFRSGTLEDSNLVARQLSPLDFLIVGSPRYIEKQGQPKSFKEFSQHKWIRFRFRQTGKLMPIMDARNSVDPGREFVVDDGEALVSLCQRGMGLTQVPHFLARDALRDKKIVNILPAYRPKNYGVWAVYAKRDYLPEKIKVFIDYVQERLAAEDEHPYSTWVETLKPSGKKV